MTAYSDNAITETHDDKLNRLSLVYSLTRMLSDRHLDTPMTIGIYGGWGTGKTSMMRMAKDALTPDPRNAPPTLWFDAWKYARSDEALWRALLLEVIEALADTRSGIPRHLERERDGEEKIENLKEEFERLRASLYRSQTWTEKGPAQINWLNAVPFAADLALRFFKIPEEISVKSAVGALKGEDAAKALEFIERKQIEQHRDHVQSLEQFQKALNDLIKEHVVERGLKFYIFIDDLDRCLPEDAIAALEAVKLFLDIKGCIFVLGMDRDVVERGILVRYPPVKGDLENAFRVNPRDYLDKVIQLPLTLPPLMQDQIKGFLDHLLGPVDPGQDPPASRAALNGCRDLIEAAVPSNPRKIKRLLNVLSLLLPLSDETDPDQARALAKIVIMQVLFHEHYEEVAKDPKTLLDMEKRAHGGRAQSSSDQPMDPRLEKMLKMGPGLAGLGQKVFGLVALTRITDSATKPDDES